MLSVLAQPLGAGSPTLGGMKSRSAHHPKCFVVIFPFPPTVKHSVLQSSHRGSSGAPSVDTHRKKASYHTSTSRARATLETVASAPMEHKNAIISPTRQDKKNLILALNSPVPLLATMSFSTFSFSFSCSTSRPGYTCRYFHDFRFFH